MGILPIEVEESKKKQKLGLWRRNRNELEWRKWKNKECESKE